MKMVPLGEVATLGSGGTPKRIESEYFGPGHYWLSIADLNDGYVNTAKESLTDEGLTNSSAKLVPAGSILVAMYGSIGKLGISEVELCTSQAIAFAIPDPELIDTRYLFNYLLAQRPDLQNRGRGGTQQNIGQRDLKNWAVPLPPLDEQRRIAAILDKADAIRQKRRQAIAHLGTLTQSIFHEMFGTAEEWTPIGELAESTQYGTSAKAGSDGEWPVLRMGNITYSGQLDLTDFKHLDLGPKEIPKYTVQKGDLLFNRTNSAELVGKTCVVNTEQPLAFAGYLVRARFPRSETAMVTAGYLNSPHGKATLRNMAKAIVGQANINATELRSIRVPTSTESIEAEYVQLISAVENQINIIKRAAENDDAMFASLQSRAFRGEL